jgi:phytoene synthase
MVMSSAAPDCWATIQRHSRSFSLAARLLPADARADAVVVYAWCRRADDAIDRAQGEPPAQALRRLRRELEELHAGGKPEEPLLSAFRDVLQARQIPLRYPLDLLDGMEMDVRGVEYRSLDQLLEYCYRVASTVGLMMCHVMGVSHPDALRPAAHLGIAMQLTNICRDVAEDWENGRLYLPADVLHRHGLPALRLRPGAFPSAAIEGCRGVLRELLGIADRYYCSSDSGLPYLSPRCALAVDVSRRVYSGIGRHLARQNYDVGAGRARVPRHEKLCACIAALASRAPRWREAFRPSFSSTALGTVSHGPELVRL